MDTAGIMECIEMLVDQLPVLRDKLDLTQRELAAVIGISRQSVIDLEHKNRKITRAILIAMISFFSLRRETALLLYKKRLYKNKYIASFGFTCDVIRRIHSVDGD